MNRFVKIGLLMALAMALFGTYRYVSAQEPNTPATKHVLLGTIISTSINSMPLAANALTALDSPQTVSCPGTTTCTIQAEQVASTAQGSHAQNGFILCFYVDGSAIPAGCPYVNITPSDGESVMGSVTQGISGVSPGTHTVQTLVKSNFGAKLFFYNTDYRVYRP